MRGWMVWVMLAAMMMAAGPCAEAAQAEPAYCIERFEDLAELSRRIAEGDGPFTGRVTLMNDIQADGAFEPIGSPERMFLGTFEGNGYTISGLKIGGDRLFAGLFGYVGIGGCVRNVTLSGAQVSGLRYTGGIAGYSMGIIENCRVEGGRILGRSPLEYGAATGGVVGLSAGSVRGCAGLDTLVVGRRTVGGIAGSQCYGTMERCLSSGSVHAWDGGEAQAGGIAGCVQTGGRVEECVSLGEVRASCGVWAGGIVGAMFSGSAVKCAFLGECEGREAGAVLGYAARGAQAAGCLYDPAAAQGTGEGVRSGVYPDLRGAMIRKEAALLLPLTERDGG